MTVDLLVLLCSINMYYVKSLEALGVRFGLRSAVSTFATPLRPVDGRHIASQRSNQCPLAVLSNRSEPM